MQLKESVFLITGGASGLGAACARRFHEHGAKVAILDINSATGSALAGELGDRATFIKCDVSVESEVNDAVHEVVKQLSGLHGAINCAGIAPGERVLGKEGIMPLSHFERVLQVNLIGTFNVIRLAGAVIAENEPNAAGERGVIINTSSVAAFEGQIGQAAYSASKGAISALTLPVAREYARFGIRVVSIAPGIFDTPLMAAMPEKVRESLGQQVPFPPRLGRPEEYAHLAQTIVENEMLNGTTLRLDGAIRMQPK